MTLPLQYAKIEYVKKGRIYHKKTEVLDDNGIQIPGSGKRSKGIKRGVFFSALTPGKNIVIGFSLVHKNDVFDVIGGKWTEMDTRNGHKKMKYVDGEKKEGFGIQLASLRATMWSEYEYYRITQNKDDRVGNTMDPTIQYVFIPQSIKHKLAKFIERCNRYYKGAHLPQWASKFVTQEFNKFHEEE